MPNISLHSSVDRTDGPTTSGGSSVQTESSAPNSEDEKTQTSVKRLSSRSDSLDVICEDDEKRSTIPSRDKILGSLKHISSETETDNSSLALNSGAVVAFTKVPLHFNNYIEPSSTTIGAYDNSNITVLEQVSEWDFPIFEMETLSNGLILSQVR